MICIKIKFDLEKGRYISQWTSFKFGMVFCLDGGRMKAEGPRDGRTETNFLIIS